jgi:hypothetical protein
MVNLLATILERNTICILLVKIKEVYEYEQNN